jgi:alanine racemase
MAQHHVEVRVSRSKFFDNVKYLRGLVAPSKLCVVMKSNAYGHGLAELAPVAVEAGADYIGICTNPEAATIRQLGLSIPLLRLRLALPAEIDESVSKLDIEEQVGSLDAASYMAAAGTRRGRPVKVHLDLDFGMGRSGFFPEEEPSIREVLGMKGLLVAGLMSHFPASDGVELAGTHAALQRMHDFCAALGSALPAAAVLHTHNSAATVRLTERRGGMVRVGAACYGVRTSSDFENPPALEPVMSFRTWIAGIRRVPKGRTIGYGSLFTTDRDSRIASLPVGFGEGYPRALFNKGVVLVRGRRCPVVGRVSLNMLTVDVTDVPGAELGDEVVLIGSQGTEHVSFEEMADKYASVHTDINLMAGQYNEITYV